MSAVFVHNDAQKRLAEKTRDREAKRRQKQFITTRILPLAEFYLAEDYHQKYFLRNDKALFREFQVMYPQPKDFLSSTAAARVNGYLGGFGTPELLHKEIDSYGLSPDTSRALREMVKRR